MTRRVVLLLAAACGVAVGNIYFPQAVTPLIVDGLHVPPQSVALVVTATQLGYALGIFLLVPLGDRIPNRRLITTLFAFTGCGLLVAGSAPALHFLAGAGVLIGATTVVGPIIGTMVAGLVDEDRRGLVTGTLLSGTIGGMLLSRTFGSALGEWLGWRAPYLAAAVLVAIIAPALALVVPTTTPSSRQSYPALLLESLRLFRAEPELRRSCFYQATIFAGFQAVWTCVVFVLTSPTYRLGTPAVGVLALLGAVTMLCTPIAGRQVDRRGPDPVNLVCMFLAVVSAGVLALGGVGGIVGLAALALGTVVLDIAMQCGMVANLARIYALRPEARSRLNTAYMTCGFLGGSLGSWVGGLTYTLFGWPSLCAMVAIAAAAALGYHLIHTRRAALGSEQEAFSE